MCVLSALVSTHLRLPPRVNVRVENRVRGSHSTSVVNQDMGHTESFHYLVKRLGDTRCIGDTNCDRKHQYLGVDFSGKLLGLG
jgi:hypothetical protein